MKPVVYIDTLFLINFVFNTVIFYISSYVLKKDISIKRLSAASLLASVYGAAVVFPQIKFLYSGFAKILATTFFSFILFGFENKKSLARSVAVCFLTALIFGGSVWLLISVFNIRLELGAVLINGIVYIDINPFILLGGIITGIFFVVFFSVAASKKEKIICKLKIIFEEKNFEINALYDTGCVLVGEGNLPAVVVDKKIISKVFGDDFFERQSLKEITFSTISEKNNKTKGFIPDKIEDFEGNILKGIIAFGAENFGGENYNAVLNPAIFDNI